MLANKMIRKKPSMTMLLWETSTTENINDKKVILNREQYLHGATLFLNHMSLHRNKKRVRSIVVKNDLYHLQSEKSFYMDARKVDSLQ